MTHIKIETTITGYNLKSASIKTLDVNFTIDFDLCKKQPCNKEAADEEEYSYAKPANSRTRRRKEKVTKKNSKILIARKPSRDCT